MPTRNVNITTEMDRFIAGKVEGGLYANASEVIRTAMRLLEREEREYEEKLAAHRAAIIDGDNRAVAQPRILERQDAQILELAAVQAESLPSSPAEEVLQPLPLETPDKLNVVQTEARGMTAVQAFFEQHKARIVEPAAAKAEVLPSSPAGEVLQPLPLDTLAALNVGEIENRGRVAAFEPLDAPIVEPAAVKAESLPSGNTEDPFNSLQRGIRGILKKWRSGEIESKGKSEVFEQRETPIEMPAAVPVESLSPLHADELLQPLALGIESKGKSEVFEPREVQMEEPAPGDEECLYAEYAEEAEEAPPSPQRGIFDKWDEVDRWGFDGRILALAACVALLLLLSTFPLRNFNLLRSQPAMAMQPVVPQPAREAVQTPADEPAKAPESVAVNKPAKVTGAAHVEIKRPLGARSAMMNNQLTATARIPRDPRMPNNNVPLSSGFADNGAEALNGGGMMDSVFKSQTGPNVKTGTPTKLVISAGVVQGMLIQRTAPVYPSLAKAARVQGTVVIQASISPKGMIENPRVVNGPYMLRQPALDAVKTWRYRPYMLNGEPVEVETTVNVNFALNQ